MPGLNCKSRIEHSGDVRILARGNLVTLERRAVRNWEFARREGFIVVTADADFTN